MATVTTNKDKDKGKGKDGGIFDRFFTGCAEKGPCYWLYHEELGYYLDPDKPNECGGSCHCSSPVRATHRLRRKLGLDPNSFETDCVGPGQMGPTEEQVETLIELLETITRLKRIVLGLFLVAVALGGLALYLATR